ncbi:SIMPL domain-containing protein [Flavisolibacter sp. BT320]|nr:SIMPL domain-containing protein [Flavisolibacter longurius]
MRLLIVICLILISSSSYSQNANIPTIRVTGSATVKVKPDIGVINIEVSEIRPKMADAIAALTEKSNVYNDLLKRLAISEKNIKTTNFQVSQNRLYRGGEYLDSGYIASQKLRIEFVYEQKLLQQIVGEFAQSESPINFDIQFELSEQLKSKVQSQIIEFSVKDATDKANSIAKASTTKLVKILTITYGNWDQPKEMELVDRTRSYNGGGAASETASTFNFTPEELVFRDALTIEWIIK